MKPQALLLGLASATSAANIYRRTEYVAPQPPSNQTQPKPINHYIWTFTRFTRTCINNDTTCSYSYGIDTHGDGVPGACSYTVYGFPASRQEVSRIECPGGFTVSSKWSGQFGEGNGFTTLAVIRGPKIAWPAYSDGQLVDGVPVEPDQSYIVYSSF